MKLTIWGGGSTYTPELMDGIGRRKEFLPFSEICLFDPDSSRLEVLTEFSKRQLGAFGLSAKVWGSRDLSAALDGADFVVSQIRVGGQAARQKDIELGLKHELVGQETTGCGGFACALRHIPPSLELAKQMEKFCPHAILLNFTNPAGIVTEAVLGSSKIRVLGICNVSYVMRKDLADYFHVPWEEVQFSYFGLNHLSWAAPIHVRGLDRTQEVLENFSKLNAERYNFSPELIENLGALPSPYLRYYYSAPEVTAELKKAGKTRAQEVMEIESDLLKRYQDQNLCEKPQELMKRGGIYYGEVAASVMKALVGQSPETHIVNLPNGKLFPWLSEKSVTEAPWKLNRKEWIPEPAPQVPLPMRSLMIQVKTYETLTIQAAITGSRREAYLALLVNPLVGTASKAKEVLDELLSINQPFLPRFFR